jgi:23S rRNA U2552 (ribose-2'-O)-methylase RlmE/FtsJ
MTYFLLPKTFSKTYESIYCSELDTSGSPVFISCTLSQYLSTLKEKITPIERTWDIHKKYTNPYEYIHTPVPMKKKSVAKIRPISRSYFKMIEILYLFELIPNTDTSMLSSINHADTICSNPIKTFHLAEGPGGFIEAIATIRNNPDDKYYGMTLIDKTPNSAVPTWKKSADFLGRFPNVQLEYGVDGTGNILVLENLRHCKEHYGSSMDIITGDGGFDFSIDFNQQEIAISKLLYGQLSFAVTMQKHGGSFVLKIFDSFMKHTLDILYLLASFYETVHIVKPKTSRYANSEKYIVCKGFLFDSNKDFFPFIERGFIQMMYSNSNIDKQNIIDSSSNNTNTINSMGIPCRILSFELPYYFIQKLEEYNSIFGQKQIQNIHFTITLIEHKHKQDKINILIKTNIQKSVNWCMKYGINHNIFNPVTNIFLDNK